MLTAIQCSQVCLRIFDDLPLLISHLLVRLRYHSISSVPPFTALDYRDVILAGIAPLFILDVTNQFILQSALRDFHHLDSVHRIIEYKYSEELLGLFREAFLWCFFIHLPTERFPLAFLLTYPSDHASYKTAIFDCSDNPELVFTLLELHVSRASTSAGTRRSFYIICVSHIILFAFIVVICIC